MTYDTSTYNYNSCDSTYETSDTFVPEHSTYDYYEAKSASNDIGYYDTNTASNDIGYYDTKSTSNDIGIYGIENNHYESPSLLRTTLAEPTITNITPLTTPMTTLTTPLIKEPGKSI